MKKLGVILFTFLFAGYSHAALEANKIYFGGGLGMNSLSGIDFSDGLGFQIFAGYDLPVKMGQGTLSVEAGYMDTGDMTLGVTTVPTPAFPFFAVVPYEDNLTGVWANAVYSLPLQNKLSLLGRAGLDFGDDDGLMLGAGVGLQLDSKMEIRAEYVIRDTIDSLQVNLVIRQ